MQKPPEKPVLNNFATFTGKHLRWRLFLIQNIVNFVKAPILKNICERLLLKMLMKPRKVKNWLGISIQEQNFSTSLSETSESVARNELQTINMI